MNKAALFRFFLQLFVTIFALDGFAAVTKEDRANINKIIAKYRKSVLVKTQLEKKTSSKLLNRDTEEKGQLYFSGGLIRYETKQPDPALVVFDGKYLWNVQLPSADFGGETIVARAEIDQKNRQQVIVTELLTKESLFRHFDLNEAKTTDQVLVLDATPKKGDWSLSKIKMHFSLKDEVVSRIEYWDDLNNHSDLKLNKQEFPEEPNKKLFNYKPPKGVKVNKL